MSRNFFCFLLILLSFKGTAQDTLQGSKVENYYDLSLEELMNIKISVASVKELTARESPGIVTLLTNDDIINIGARDLTDVLKMVPGFDFGVDVEGVVGIGVRGNWAHEGKILLLIDGQVMNENLYSSIQMGNHYPVDNVERIEIIRGPGSAIYGDFAEYAVINIVTRKGKDLTGSVFSASYGQMSKTFGHRKFNVSVGDDQKDFSYAFSASLIDANRSQEEHKDVFRNSYDMTDQSGIKNAHINLGLNFKDYQFRGIIDNYRLSTRDAYQENLSQAYPLHFDSYLFELKKDFRILRKLTLTPKFNYKNQTPWSYKGSSVQDEFEVFEINSQRYTGTLTVNYDINDHINITGGTEYFTDRAAQKAGGVFNTNNSDVFQYENTAVFAQTLVRTRFATLTAGARYINNSEFASSFVPRIGITKTINKLHIKLLFSKAFRAPNTQNIDLNSEIKPENTTVFEAETGYQLSSKMSLTLNAFDISTKDPIIYSYNDLLDEDVYMNYEKTGTRGFEIEYKYKSGSGYLGLNYSFYIPSGNALSNYAVPGNPDALLAFPAHRINLTSGKKIFNNLKLNSTISFSGPRYAIVSLHENAGDTIVKKFNPNIIASLNVCYNNLFTKGLDASIGVYNLADAKNFYIQPYNSLHAPLPGTSREFVMKLSYIINFKQH
ncbi:MAG TPA: TonB-dependent receptor plug domain-containing protein [Bacteroidia bacterium]|nr:TonB-dependent receptor plug domain-containing protein [Bacteroidia bacterium]